MTLRGRDSYTTWRFHIYGCPRRTSHTSIGATSYNTSYLKGLMPYGRRHCWVMQIPRPWLSHRCCKVAGVVLSEAPISWRLLLRSGSFDCHCQQQKCRGIPFTHICEWNRRSFVSDPSGSSSWICAVATVAVGSTSMIFLPLYVAMELGLESESRSDSEYLILATNDLFERHSSVLCQGI